MGRGPRRQNVPQHPVGRRTTGRREHPATFAGMGVNTNLNNFLILLHIGCALLGFGGVAFNGIYLLHAHHRSPQQRAAIIEANRDVTKIAEILIYAVPILGLLVVATSKSYWSFKQGWLSAALLLYIIDLGILHGFIFRIQKQYNGVLERVNASPLPAGSGPPDEVAVLSQLEQRISFGWIGFDVVFLIVVYLMVFKP
jgi:uncharacterized membrane protein